MHTIKTMVALTGASDRALQHWADRGVLLAVEGTSGQGTGRWRLFSSTEAIIGCIVAAFHQDAFPLGRLLNVAREVRGILQNYTDRETIFQAVRGDAKVFMIYDQQNGMTVTSWFALNDASFWKDYLENRMTDSNVKANIVYLTGAFAGLRANNFIIEE